ncbi:MAG: pilus assembly protein N-terminal domain-containing protein [Bacillota bacterium]
MNSSKAFVALALVVSVALMTPAAPPASAQGVGGRAESPSFAVVVSQSRILQVKDVVRVAVADPAIADVVVASKTEVIVIGKAEGKTTLHVWDSSGRTSLDVRVYVNNEELLREIESAIGTGELRARFARATLVLDGAVETDAESRRAELIARAYADKVLNLITVKNPASPPPPAVIEASEVQAAIGIEGVQVRVLKDTVILEGRVPNPLDADRAEQIARIFSDKVLNFIQQPAVEVISGSQKVNVTVARTGEATGP